MTTATINDSIKIKPNTADSLYSTSNEKCDAFKIIYFDGSSNTGPDLVIPFSSFAYANDSLAVYSYIDFTTQDLMLVKCLDYDCSLLSYPSLISPANVTNPSGSNSYTCMNDHLSSSNFSFAHKS